MPARIRCCEGAGTAPDQTPATQRACSSSVGTRLWNVAMTTNELNLFSYEVLGLVGSGEVGPHDLRRMVRQGRILDWAGESQYYVEPKRLAKLGYLEAR